jgi:ABC-type amino acid transport substrate-binding protein
MSRLIRLPNDLTVPICSMTVVAILKRLLLLPLLFCALHAQAQESGSPAKLVVGTMRVPPFVLRTDDGQWSGLSVDLWKQIAAEMKTEFEFREYDYDPAGLLEAVEQRKIDLAIAAIPMTHNDELRFDFSHPYFTAGLAIAVHAEPPAGVFATLAGLVTPQILVPIAGLLGLLLAVGTLMWLIERRQGAHFHPDPARGIGDGLWWAAVTMTTTGYGDKVPISWRGRTLGLVWMFSSIFLIALFSATLASSLVISRLKTSIAGPGDLPRARVAMVSGSPGEQWLAAQGVQGRAYAFVIQASKALQRGDVDALIYERPILGHMIKQYSWGKVHILPHTLAVHEYAIALPPDSPIKESLNRALLKVIHRPDWQDVVKQYVGETDEAATAGAP